MIIKLKWDEVMALTEVINRKKQSEIEALGINKISINLELEEVLSDDLREDVSNFLTEVGFDENYKTNTKGKILEGIIDKLFVG